MSMDVGRHEWHPVLKYGTAVPLGRPILDLCHGHDWANCTFYQPAPNLSSKISWLQDIVRVATPPKDGEFSTANIRTPLLIQRMKEVQLLPLRGG